MTEKLSEKTKQKLVKITADIVLGYQEKMAEKIRKEIPDGQNFLEWSSERVFGWNECKSKILTLLTGLDD